MNPISPAHIACYISVVAVFLCGLFFDNNALVFVKPLSSLVLIWLYVENRNRVNALYLLIIVIIMINDAFILTDFDKYFEYIGVLLPMYYLLCSYLLRKYITFNQIKLLNIFTPPVLISTVLIAYLTFTIYNLVMPSLEGLTFYAILILVTLFYYLGNCFLIYLRNQYTHVSYLFIAASSCILVNALVPIQELYYNHSIFAALINSVDIIAMFFYLKFLIEAEPIEKNAHFENFL